MLRKVTSSTTYYVCAENYKFKEKKNSGGKQHILFCKEPGGSQSSVTPAPRDVMPSSGLCRHSYLPLHTLIPIHIKTNKSKFLFFQKEKLKSSYIHTHIIPHVDFSVFHHGRSIKSLQLGHHSSNSSHISALLGRQTCC